MRKIEAFWNQFICRVFHGHIMVCFGIEDRGRAQSDRAYYGCARCGRCEIVSWAWDAGQMYWRDRA